MVTKYRRPRDAAEALAMLAGEPGSLPLAGGTYLLSSRFKDLPLSVVSIDGILPSAIARSASSVELGANATFQDILDSPAAPAFLKAAAGSMANRNIRNRATVGGNLGASKSCGSLAPILIVAGAVLRLEDGAKDPRGREIPAADWLALPEGEARGLIASVALPLAAGRRMAFGRWSRTACDLSVLTAAVALSGGAGAPVSGLRIAMGGLGPRARRFPELEALFEGRPFPGRDEAEAAIAPLLEAKDDVRGSAAFKRLRAAALLADALRDATADTSRGEVAR